MNNDEQPSTANATRRRSLFENEAEKQQDETLKDIPGLLEEATGITYPPEYTEKVASEISQWKMHITKVLDEMKESNYEKELKATVVNEDLLSTEQMDFFNSLKFDRYVQRTREFYDRVQIFLNVLDYKPETEAEYWYRAAQKKIKEDIEKM